MDATPAKPKPDPATIDREAIVQRLVKASIEDPPLSNRRWVRMKDAAAAIGCHPSLLQSWERHGLVETQRFRVPNCRKAMNGRIVVIELDGLEYAVRQWRPRPIPPRRWTRQEDELLERWVGRRTLAWIARELGRTVAGVKCRCKNLGISQNSAMGLWTCGQVAEIAGVDKSSVWRWCERNGLRHRRAVDRRRTRLIDIADFYHFIKDRPAWERMRPERRRRIIDFAHAPAARRRAA